jgi:hypothetical protein
MLDETKMPHVSSTGSIPAVGTHVAGGPPPVPVDVDDDDDVLELELDAGLPPPPSGQL